MIFRDAQVFFEPYFDLAMWNPRGNRAKEMRAGINQAKRAGVVVEQIFRRDLAFCDEVFDLCESWSKTRRAAVKFGWLFELAPFQHAEYKKFFTARNIEGKPVGLLAASPIPAREGWYLEDVLRAADSPNGTTDLLVYEALKNSRRRRRETRHARHCSAGTAVAWNGSRQTKRLTAETMW